MTPLIDRIPICPHGTKDDIDISLKLALEKLELKVGYALNFSSGYRCYDCNLLAGGVKQSAHMRGLAVDVRADNSGERFHILHGAVLLGFQRIGIGKNFIHLDVDYDLPQQALWLY